MDHSVTFARHFARLIWLLIEQPENTDEQKASLRALVTVSRDGPVTLATSPDGISANGQPVAGAMAGVLELALRLAAHGAGELAVHASAAPADILNAARLLAADPVAGEPTPERLRATGARTVHLTGSPPGVAEPRAHGSTALDGFDLVIDDAPAPAEPRPRTSGAALAHPAPGAPGSATTGGLFDQFAAQRAEGHEELLAALDAAPDGAAPELLDRLANAAEKAQREGQSRVLTAIVAGVIRREQKTAPEWRRDFTLAMRRMTSPHALRMIAALLPRRVVPKEDLDLILTRTGEDGADAVIEQLTQAQTATDRRAYYDLLLTLRSGIPALTHMLGDARWYVVRNAADLLGEMGVVEAEKPILALLQHPDERVRGSATAALLRLDTTAGRNAVHAAMQSDSPATRQQAIIALGTRRDSGTASMLLRALDREPDEGVQRTFYAALGRVATDDAVERLIRAAEPATGLFKRKSSALRAAAALALGDAKTPAALEALRALVDNRDRDVRDAALRALSNARRGDEPRVTGLFEAIRE